MLLAEILRPQRQLAFDLLVDGGRYADAAGLGDRFQARRDIDRIAHQVVAAFHDVAEIDADAQDELVVRSGLVVGGPHRFLDFQGGADGFDRAREFRQEPVAGQLEDASAMMLHQRLGGRHAGAEEAERVFLVARRHGAEADDVDVHDRGQAPDELGFSHGGQARAVCGQMERVRFHLTANACIGVSCCSRHIPFG